MIDQSKGTIEIVDENNKKVKIQVLFSFEATEYKKKYVVYTTDLNNEDDEIEILISEINPDTFEIKSIPDDEADSVMELYESAKQMILNKEEN